MTYLVPLADAEHATADRVGAKAATLARLLRAGLPVPDGVCLTGDAYRAQLGAAGALDSARAVAGAHGFARRRRALDVRLAFQRVALDPAVAGALAAGWRALATPPGVPAAVRSSALLEDTPGTSFAGQFDSFLGIASEADLVTAVRACWASLWSTRALDYMIMCGVDPAATAMAVLLQRLVDARAAGGALSRSTDGHVLLSATWGLGCAIAQGEVVPDRIVARRDGTLVEIEPGRKDRRVGVSAEAGARPRAVAAGLVEAPCLSTEQAQELARLVVATEAILGRPVEVEWALGADGLQIVQARPLRVEASAAPDAVWARHPGLRGQPAGVGWGSGRARIVLHEHDLERVEPGDVLVTQVAGPALTTVLSDVAAVVAELGGSTSHLAALARERGIPAVLGVAGATRRIPDRALVAVDGVAGVVRWVV